MYATRVPHSWRRGGSAWMLDRKGREVLCCVASVSFEGWEVGGDLITIENGVQVSLLSLHFTRAVRRVQTRIPTVRGTADTENVSKSQMCI